MTDQTVLLGGLMPDQPAKRKPGNALKHGLLRRKIKLMPGESRYLFNQMNRNLMDYWQPENLTESMLVEQLTFNYWRLKRAFKLETEFFLNAQEGAVDNEAFYERMGHKKKSYASNYLKFDEFDKFTRYITSIQRQILRILHELERVQAGRKGQNIPITGALDIDIKHGQH